MISPAGEQSSCTPAAATHLRTKGWTVIADQPAPLAAKNDDAVDGERPKGNASREAWVAYATSIDVDVAEDATRNEIREAAEAAEAPEAPEA